MSQTLIAGANVALPNDNITLRIISQRPIDCATYRLSAAGKVRGDGDMIFYGQTQSDDHSIRFRGHDTDGFFDIDLPKQPTLVEKIAVAFSSDIPLSQLGDVSIQVLQGSQILIECQVIAQNRSEKALILAECYRRQGAWKFRFISQGFDGGLKPLSEYFGVEIADSPAVISAPIPASSPVPVPAKPATINLSKITLTKNQSSINLQKKEDFGKISINLNWHQNTAPKKGKLAELFNAHTNAIDLDLGAFVILKNGSKVLVQALGNGFGAFEKAPFVKLRADDRTGQVTEGEWLDVNGQYWQQIEEVLIFTFIYRGVPNWSQTDALVSIHMPNQAPIETFLTDGANHLPMCAIARLKNQNGSLNVERIDQYFKGHQEMDNAFGWGLQWKAARK